MPLSSSSLGRALALVLLALGLAAPAMAREGGHALLKACQADRTAFCAAEKPGGGRVALCLKQHETELAPQCRAAMSTAAECAPQIKAVCGEASGAAALRSCVKAHAGELPASCRGGS